MQKCEDDTSVWQQQYFYMRSTIIDTLCLRNKLKYLKNHIHEYFLLHLSDRQLYFWTFGFSISLR
jgi:hypothetical protein